MLNLRRYWPWWIVAAIPLTLAACGEDNPMAPPVDPFAPMYGTYIGTLTMQFETGLTQDPVTLRLGPEGEVSLTLTGASYSTAIVAMTGTTIQLNANVGGFALILSGHRAGNTISGNATFSGLATGSWSVRK